MRVFLLAIGTVLTACSPSDLVERLRREAVVSVSNHLTTSAARPAFDLYAASNAWGEGFLVHNRDVRNPDDVRIWVNVPRVGTFAFDEASAALTPDLPRLSAADEKVQERVRLRDMPAMELRRKIFRSIRDGKTLWDIKFSDEASGQPHGVSHGKS